MEQKINKIATKNHVKQKDFDFLLEEIKQQKILNLAKILISYYKSKFPKSGQSNLTINNETVRNVFLQKLNSWLKDITIEGLSLEWEKNIKKSVEKLIKKKYDNIFFELMCEIRQIYFQEMQIFSLHTILGIEVNENEKVKLNTKKMVCLSFEKNRSSLMKKYFLSHSLVRFIIKTAFFNLPQLFLNLTNYKSMGHLQLTEFRIKINNDIKKASLKILSHYYNLIVKSLPKLLKKKNPDSNHLKRIIHCASVLFAQQIINIKMNTIIHLINSLKDSLLLHLDLIFEMNNLSLMPNISEICQTFHEIINNVSIITTDLVPFEYYFQIKTKQEFINVKLPKWFMSESHINLDQVLKSIFHILEEYHFRVNIQFQLICQPRTRENVLQLIAEDREFEEYCSQVKVYLTYQNEVNGMVSKFYYKTGILNQLPARNILKSKTQELINILLEFLTGLHLQEAGNICSEFENLKTRALNIPKDANSLFELSEYMSNGAKKLVLNLEQRVYRSIQQLCSLLEITLLTEHHINLNKQNINWLESIKPIFIQSNTLSEAMKSESEDELQQEITILNNEIDQLIPEFVILDDMDDAKRVQNYREYLKSLLGKMQQIEVKINQINFEERLFKFPETNFPKDVELREIIGPFSILISLICEWQRDHEVWLNGPFEYLNAEIIEQKTKFFHREIIESNKMFKTKIKMDVTVNKAFKFSGIVDDPDAMQQPAPLKLCWQVLKDIENFLNFVPLAICFCNSALRKRHWNEISSVAGVNLLPNAGTTLQKIIKLDLMKHIEIFQVISTGANKELSLQNQVEAMFEKWESINFAIVETNEIFHFIESETIELLLDEHFSKIHNIRGSYFVKPAENRVLELNSILIRLKNFIQQWQNLQTLTNKYQPLFSNIQAIEQLPQELILFTSIKESLLQIREKINLKSTFNFGNQEIINNLEKNNSKLKIIQEGIKKFLDQQRFNFARFFFISDDEILKILFYKTNPQKLSLHLKKCFPGVKTIPITNSLRIKSIIGDFNEKILLDSVLVGKCENSWLHELETKIHQVLKKKLVTLQENFDFSLENIFQNPGMIINCCWQIDWTRKIENCLEKFEWKNWRINAEKMIEKTLDWLKSPQSRLMRSKISSLVSVQIHQNDIIDNLVEKNVRLKSDFYWRSHLRYYFDGTVRVNLMNVSINYAFEYNNNLSIVNTPLTERCYQAIIEAYHYQYFANLTGPSATGKTETLRSLAKSFALPFHVYNGNDKLSQEFIDRILQGLVKCGAWICIKNFDQINQGILSVISEKIVSISRVNKTGFIAIVLNSENSRRKLPETIKYRFRTIAMILPDVQQICRVELLAAGFQNWEILSEKIKNFQQFSSEMLNYRFDLRNIKLVLKVAIYLKEQFPTENENILILRALIDVNISRFTNSEISTFQGILKDLFFEISLPTPNLRDFLSAFETVSKKYQLAENDPENFKLKLIEFFEMLHIQNGIIIIGEPMSGKTTILKVMQEILKLQHQKIQLETINPGAITYEQFYGDDENLPHLWKDGIFLKIFRNDLEKGGKKWIIFDGEIYNKWIENLHSILDNGTLILNSQEKLMKEGTKFFIECLDLREVSPVTISRFGIICKQIENWRNYLKPLIENLDIKMENPDYKSLIYSLFDWTIDNCVEFIEKNCRTIIKVNQLHLIMSNFNLFRILLMEMQTIFEKGKPEYLVAWLQAIFITSTIWSLAGTLDTLSLKLFNSFYLSLWNSSSKMENRPQCLKQNEMSLPSEGLLTDYIYIFKGTGNWKHCSEFMKNEKNYENPTFGDIFIPTVDSIKYFQILEKHFNQKVPFILCSDETMGKTFLIRDLISKKQEENLSVNNFHFTEKITGQRGQKLFLSKLIKRKSNIYGPSKNFSINFIDNFNSDDFSPKREFNSLLEILRQFFDYGYWYDVETGGKCFINDTTFILEINKINEKLCRRFLRHFSIYVMHLPSKESIFRIFTNQLFLNLKKNSFALDVMPILNGIVNATIELYFSVQETLKPIPNKMQYIFNLRDISRIIRACSIVQRESVETKITFIRLWVHEAFRVFTDRMIDQNDKNWFFTKLKDNVRANFKDSFETIFDNLPKSKIDDELTLNSFEFLHFGNFINEKKYEEISSMEQLQIKIASFIADYNFENKIKIDMIVTNFFLQHLIRICRILSIPGENLLMICSSGYGRKTIIRLACYIQRQNLFQPDFNAEYNLEEWRKDLKENMKNCVTMDENFAILVTDIFDDEFHDDVINLLETGQLPELFSPNDEREIVSKIRLAAQNGNRNLELTISDVLDYFTKQCKKNLHFIICLQLKNFAKLGKNSPMVKTCTMNCISSWPDETFQKVSEFFLADIPMREEIKISLQICFQYFHSMIAGEIENSLAIAITPVIFHHHVKIYRKIILAKQKELKIAKGKYMSCLEKLKIASNQVDQMKKVLMTLRPQLEASAQQTRNTMEEVENENLAVEKATIIVKDEEKIANEKADIAGKLRTECETDLAVAIPILEDAISALNTLKPTDITLVKAMKNPPDTVKLVMAAVCVMLDVPSERIIDPVTGKKSSDFWGPSKRVLGDMNFLQNLKDYDKDNIAPSLMQVIKSIYMTDKSFLPHIVAKASSAAEGLCKWVRAMVSYDEVAKAVAPKKEKLALAQKECDDAEAYLTEKRETLADLNERLANLKTSLESVLAKKQELEKEVADCTDRLKKAESLLTSLGGEKSRWIRCTDNLEKSFNSLAGDILLASGLIIYLSSFNLQRRVSCLENWTQYVRDRSIPLSDNFHFCKILASEKHFHSNSFIHQNSLIVHHTDTCPLLIDPQNKATDWIRNFEKELKITKVDDLGTIRDDIFECITLGKAMLIENFPVGKFRFNFLDPIFYQIIYIQEGEKFMDIMGQKIPYSEDFRFYLTITDQKNIQTGLFNRVTIIDFTYPEEALRENLLDIVIAKENYQLQDNYEKLRSELSHCRRVLNAEEEKVLNILSRSSVNILEDRRALKILDSSKTMSIDILNREQIAIEEKKRLQLFRDGYAPFANYSAEIYSLIQSLGNLHHCYQFSIPWYFQIYQKSIETAKRSTILQKRLNFLNFQLTRKLHASVKNSLFEKDKLIFSFTLSLKMLRSEGSVNQHEIDTFWQETSETPKFPYSKSPESVDSFEKLLKVRLNRPDRILDSCRDFIENKFGKNVSNCDISLAFEESTCLSPLIFILPSHVALLPLITKFARQKRYESKLFSVAMNENQGERAEFLIKDAQKSEKWIFLENCHLAENWLFRLENIIENFKPSNTTLGFRLWLSILPIRNVPIKIFQLGIKITCDAPIGLRENLLMVYNSEPVGEKTFFEGCPGRDKIFSKLLYSLSFFHVIMKERKSYGHRGWNINYDFNESDFSLSALQLKNLINSNCDEIFPFFFHLIQNCSYGTKISNQYDRKRLEIFIDDFFKSEIINDPFYTFSQEMGFSMPRRHEYNDYIQEIMEIGNDCNAEFFGLDESGKLIRNLQQVKLFENSFKCMNQIVNDSKVEMKTTLEIISQIREKLKKEKFNLEEIENKFPICYQEPLHGILIHEIKNTNFILKVLENNFQNVENAYRGDNLWKSEYDTLCKNLTLNKIPKSWKIKFNVSSSISTFIDNLSEKIQFLQNWINCGNPKSFNLGLFDSTKALLTAIKMTFARSKNHPINNINFNIEITSNYELTNSNDFQLYGLFLLGGQWNIDKKLLENNLNTIWYQMPVIRLNTNINSEDKFEKFSNIYECPLYKVPYQRNSQNYIEDENNFIIKIPLTSEINEKYWIIKGTALYSRKE